MSISYSVHESLGTCYQCYTTTRKKHPFSDTLCPWESLGYLNQFQYIPHNVFTTCNLFYLVLEKHLTFSTETHGNVIPSPRPPPPPSQEGKREGTKR